MTGLDLEGVWQQRQQQDQPAQGSQPTQAVGITTDQLEGVWQRRHDQVEQAALASFELAAKTDTKKRAEAQQLARDLGVDPDTAERNIDVMRESWRRNQIADMRLAENYPVLAAHMADLEFAKIAHDQVDKLSLAERFGQNWDAGRMTVERGRLATKVMHGYATPAEIKRLAEVDQAISGLAAQDGVITGFARMAGQLAETVPGAAKAGVMGGLAGAGTAAVLGQLGPQVAVFEELATVPAGFMLGSKAGVTSYFAAQTYMIEAGNAYKDYVSNGYSHSAAKQSAVAVGILNSAFEIGGLAYATAPLRNSVAKALRRDVAEALVRPTTKAAVGRLLSDYGKQLSSETVVELMQEMSAMAGEEVARWRSEGVDGIKPSSWTKGEVWDRLVDTAIATVQGMALMAVPMPGARFALERGRVKRAEEAEKFFRNIGKASDTPMRDDAPAKYRAFAAQAYWAGGENAYVKSDKLVDALRQADKEQGDGLSKSNVQQFAEQMPEVYRQIVDAEAAGVVVDIVIPTADYATFIAGRDLDSALLPHLRLDPDAPSSSEVQQYLTELMSGTEADKVAMQQAMEADETRAEKLWKIEKDLVKQIKATDSKIADFQAAVIAKLYRSLVDTQSARSGKSIEEWVAEHGLRVDRKSQRVAGESVKQGERIETPEFSDRGTFDPKDPNILRQDGRAEYVPSERLMALGSKSDLSSFLHEFGHYYLDVLAQMARVTNPAPEVAADMAALLQWFGIEGGVEAWNAMSLEQQGPHHEAFAYSIEIYMFAGKAPSLELQPVFSRVVMWLKTVYKVLQDEVAAIYKRETKRTMPAMTGEVRAVMDRMLASDEQIEHMRAVRSMKAGFLTKEQFQGSEAAWNDYIRLQEADRDAAMNALRAASLRDYNWTKGREARLRKELQADARAARKAMTARVKAELAEDPIYSAIEFMRTGKFLQPDGTVGEEENHRMDWDAVERMLGLAKKAPAPAPVVPVADQPVPKARKDAAQAFGVDDRRPAPEETNEERAAREADEAERDAERAALEIPVLLEDPQAALEQMRTLLKHGGVAPEYMAGLFGYGDNVSGFLYEILAAKPLDEEVVARVDSRMLQEHGELVDPEQIEDAVARALHSELRTRFVATELKHVSKATEPIQVMMAAARQAAIVILNGRQIGMIRPHEFEAGAARSRRDADMAMRKGDSAAAMAAKRAELVQMQLARLSRDVKDELAKAKKLAEKLGRADKHIAQKRNIDIVQAARAIAGAMGLGRAAGDPMAALAKVEKYRPDLAAELRDQVMEATAIAKTGDWRTMRLDDFRMAMDIVRELWWRAKRTQEIRVDGQRVKRKAVQDELLSTMNAYGIPAKVLGREHAVTAKERFFKIDAMTTKAALLRVEHWFRRLDGGKRGAFTRYLFEPIRDGLDAYRRDRSLHMNKLKAILSALKLEHGEIDGHEIGYKFGSGTAGEGMAELLGALLHTGNAGNFQRLLVGRGWAKMIEAPGGKRVVDRTQWDKMIERLIEDGRLRAEHFDAIQAILNLAGELLPGAQKAHFELYGYNFKEVVATPIKNSLGTWAGGYAPAKIDTEIADQARTETAEDLANDARKLLPGTDRNFTKDRAQENDKPLMLDIRMMSSHFDKVLRFTHLQSGVADVLSLVKGKDSEVGKTLNRIQYGAVEKVLIPWLTRVATQRLDLAGPVDQLDTVFRIFRRMSGVAMLAGSVVNALQQTTGIANSNVYVPARFLRGALVEVMSGRGAKLVDTDFMRDRLSQSIGQLHNDVNELILNGGLWAQVKAWTNKHAYFMQHAVQNLVDIVTWIGAYNHSMEQQGASVDDATAVKIAKREADSVVRRSQGSSAPEDVAAYEVGTPLWRAWTQFTGYLNNTLNQVMEARGWGKKTMVAFKAFVLPAIIGMAIAKTVRGQWEDEDDDGYLDDALAAMLAEQGRGLAGMFPFVGPFVAQWGKGTRMSMPPAFTFVASLMRSADTAIPKLFTGEEISSRDIRDLASLLSAVTGVPLTLIGRPVATLKDVIDE